MGNVSSWIIPKVSRAGVDAVYGKCVGSSEPGWEEVQGEGSGSCMVSPPGQHRTFSLTPPELLFAPLMSKISRGTGEIESSLPYYPCPIWITQPGSCHGDEPPHKTMLEGLGATWSMAGGWNEMNF